MSLPISQFRLIIDPPNLGDWNMAADEVLLRSSDQTGSGTLRFYQWSVPTLSLGYFQSHAARHQHAASADCPLIRRASGGGAIVHDQELTYSFALPLSDRWSHNAERLYTTVHTSLIETLRIHKIDCELNADGRDANPHGEPFLCFQRRAKGDVILNGHKVMGSAQRRTKHGLLQHGSLLLKQSTFAPELPGIAEIAGVALKAQEIAKEWTIVLEDRFSAVFREDKRIVEEASQTNSLAAEKYRQDAWTVRR